MNKPLLLLLPTALLLLFADLGGSRQFVFAQQAQQEVDETIEGLMDDAREHLMDQDVDGALEHLEEILADHPEQQEAMVMAAQAYFVKGVAMAGSDRKAANIPLRKGAKLLRRFAKLKEQLNPMERQMVMLGIYNEACCEAVDGNDDQAIKLLKEAVDMGYDDVGQIQNDSDFAALKEDPRFVALLEKAKSGGDNADDEDEDEDGR